MSIEKAIAELTAAVQENTAAFAAFTASFPKSEYVHVTAAEVVAKRDETGSTMKDAKEAVIKEKKETKAEAKEKPAAESKDPAKEDGGKKEVTYDNIKDDFVKWVGKSQNNRNAAVAKLTEFGAKGLSGVKDNQEALDAIYELMTSEDLS